MRKLLALIFVSLVLAAPSGLAQTKMLRDFAPVLRELDTLCRERTGVKVQLKLKTVITHGRTLDLYFTESLGDLPWSAEDQRWFKKELADRFPEAYKDYVLGDIFVKNVRNLKFQDFVTPPKHNDGRAHESEYRVSDPKSRDELIVRQEGGIRYDKGLYGRQIALWQSHGRYYHNKSGKWLWQRARLFNTVEDMYTQSYVLPFLIPMLENAGAYVMTPRERDTQIYEVICDNDPAFAGERKGTLRRSGTYAETGKWETSDSLGFADAREIYYGNDNPFRMGTVRQADCTDKKKPTARAIWTPDIPERGNYAVYVSYSTLENSSSAAHYTVRHLGGETAFVVNQTMGGGTWIYLGSFEFAPGAGSCVSLDNATPEGYEKQEGKVVTADAVKIGGGLGKIARGPEDKTDRDGKVIIDTSWHTSGLPSYMEGALYWMQWAGIDSTITRFHETDYTNDFAGRGAWTRLMSGGSRVNPEEPGKGIPFDLSLAFHSDAGTTPNDSIIGTLAIYTLLCDKKRELPTGEDRMQCREYCDFVQSQIVNDIRSLYEPEWNRRQIWDRSYSESRTTGVPAMLLELLSHQNFADMKYGLDPAFRFMVSRAVYKGMLKFLSNRYGCPYAVQPLPVQAFSAVLEKDRKSVLLSWEERADELEPTATAKAFILYTRMDDGGFDQGRVIEDVTFKDGKYYTKVPIEKGRLYSFKIAACNEGGRSFESEILAAGVPRGSHDREVMVVNNFDRVSAPAWFDSPDFAGFDMALDSGMPYIKDISFIGEQYEFRRSLPWVTDENPGFGGSNDDLTGLQVAGNTFDFVAMHGKAIMEAGYAFSSMSSKAFAKSPPTVWTIDLLCGKQLSTVLGRGTSGTRFSVFPVELQEAIREATANGANILISGANIGRDVWSEEPHVHRDSTYMARTRDFVQTVLGYRLETTFASRSGSVRKMDRTNIDCSLIDRDIRYFNVLNDVRYCVESVDGIVPASEDSDTFLRYADTYISAGVFYDGGHYRTISLGFPLESVMEESNMDKLIRTALGYFEMD